MKQILQNLNSGAVTVSDVPSPALQNGRVLVRTVASLISAGTERSKIDMGKKSLIGKAQERPDLVRQVIQKAKTEGIFNTYQAVRAKLDASNALGYSASGIVSEVAPDVTEFRVGDRVACAGGGYAVHAEVLSVPKNLCVKLSEAVDFESAAFATLGAIALQGVRLANPTLGETVVVIGLGLLGQLAAQLLKANGCRVFGIDLDESKIELAKSCGMNDGCLNDSDAVSAVENFTRGRGADAVLICAATSSNQPIELAGEIARLKGRVVVVGAVKMDIPREPFYHKELSVQISMSYGAGRYDPSYEEAGNDYPFGYVRWTEGRNIEAFLDLIAERKISTEQLTTHRFSIDGGTDAYKLISGETKENYLGILLKYDSERELENKIFVAKSVTKSGAVKIGAVKIGMIGAGSYAKKFLLPNFKANGAEFRGIATASGVSARDVAESYGFNFCSGEIEDVLQDAETNLIVVATRHDSHAELARRALAAGKNVFVEKPLAMNDDELNAVVEAANNSDGKLFVGFNRRFSPLAERAKAFFARRNFPLSILYRVNAGRIAKDSWIQNEREGGGRIIGEVCHFIDLMQFLTNSVTTKVFAEKIESSNFEVTDEDSIFVTLKFADGSNGTICYLAEGDKSLPKERIEIFGGGKTFVLDDFRRASAFERGRETKHKLLGQDKGQTTEIKILLDCIKNGKNFPIELNDLFATTRATFAIRESLRTSQVTCL
jgi:polar amino acid transport system substrate-binding protein